VKLFLDTLRSLGADLNTSEENSMATPCFIVICRDDDASDGTKGQYLFATRRVFETRESAADYAAMISHGREPIVVTCPHGLTDDSINIHEQALEQISRLWPEPPRCAEVDPEWVGENAGKQRAILLKAALQIAREALGKTCGV
jgi:hypothetical protein